MERLIHFSNHVSEKLAGTLHEPIVSSDKGVVLAHCFTCSRHTKILIDIAHALELKGAMALRFDFSGNGQSQGVFEESSYSKHIREITIAAEVLSKRGVSQIGFIGHSMGASIAVMAAGLGSVKAVCGLAGRLSGLDPFRFLSDSQKEELDKTGKVSFISRGRTLKLTKNFFSDAARYDLQKLITDYTGKILIIHGDKDEIIPVDDAYAAYEFNPNHIELNIISEADHMFKAEDHRRQIAETVSTWFMRQFEGID